MDANAAWASLSPEEQQRAWQEFYSKSQQAPQAQQVPEIPVPVPVSHPQPQLQPQMHPSDPHVWAQQQQQYQQQYQQQQCYQAQQQQQYQQQQKQQYQQQYPAYGHGRPSYTPQPQPQPQQIHPWQQAAAPVTQSSLAAGSGSSAIPSMPYASHGTSSIHNSHAKAGPVSYHQVPPPASLMLPAGRNVGPPNSIRPQFSKPQSMNQIPPSTAPNTNAVSLSSLPKPTLYVQVPLTPAEAAAAAQRQQAKVAPQPAAVQAPKKFPPTFSSWVERCFVRTKTSEERQQMTSLLTLKIKEVESMGRMWLLDWDKEPLPTLNPSGSTTITSLPGPPLPGPPSSHEHRGHSHSHATKRSRRWERERAEDYDSDGSDSSDEGGRKRVVKKEGKRDRAGKSRDQKKGDHAVYEPMTAEKSKIQDRAGRFGDGRALGGLQSWQRHGPGTERGGGYERGGRYGSDDEDELDLEGVAVIGTSNELEKSYYRLTAAPDPSVVRPEPVLKRALERLVRLIQEGRVNWFYTCDQFKGLRQDCTVQRLRNPLSVQVYEAHARAALEYGDLAEFNQCQTQLYGLYADGHPGCVAEFTAYKILYETVHSHSPGVGRALLHTLKGSLAAKGKNSEDQTTTLVPGLSSNAPQVVHARAVRRAVMTADYSTFFRLYSTAPHLGKALMDLILPKVRWVAVNVLLKAFKTNLPISFLAPLLGFVPNSSSFKTGVTEESSGALPGCRHQDYPGKYSHASLNEGVEKCIEEGEGFCVQWLKAHGAVVVEEMMPLTPTEMKPSWNEDPNVIQSKCSMALDVKASAGKLSIPEETKVAHGDENLSLADFLSTKAKESIR